MDAFALHHVSFRLWLWKKKGKHTDDFKTSHQLQQEYWRWLKKAGRTSQDTDKPSQVLMPACAWTAYRWPLKLSGDDLLAIGSARDAVERCSNPTPKVMATPHRIPSPSLPIKGPAVIPPRDDKDDPLEELERRYVEKLIVKKQRKAYRKIQEVVLDELVPKAAAGKESMLEKRKMERERDREVAMAKEVVGDVELSERDIFGGGHDDYKNMLARKQKRDMMRQEQSERFKRQKSSLTADSRQQRQQREEATMEMFRQMAAKFEQKDK